MIENTLCDICLGSTHFPMGGHTYPSLFQEDLMGIKNSERDSDLCPNSEVQSQVKVDGISHPETLESTS